MTEQIASTEPLTTLEITADRMGGELLKALVDEVRTAPAQWTKLSEADQEKLIARLRTVVQTETKKAVALIAKDGRDAAAVKIESMTVKDGTKVVLQTDEKAARDVLGYVGQAAVLVMCKPEVYFQTMNEVVADKDQQDLPLEGGEAAAAGDPALSIDVDDPIGEVEDEERAEAEAADEAA